MRMERERERHTHTHTHTPIHTHIHIHIHTHTHTHTHSHTHTHTHTHTHAQDEATVKTKKLKKLWSRYEETKGEVHELQKEFQQEKEDLLDTIREQVPCQSCYTYMSHELPKEFQERRITFLIRFVKRSHIRHVTHT